MVTSASTIEPSRTLAQTTLRSPMTVVEDLAAAPDDRVPADATSSPRRTTPGSMVTSSAMRDGGVDERAGAGPTMVTPARMWRLVDAQAQLELGVGQLGAVVDAQERAVVVDLEGGHRPVVGARERHELRQVELAGRGRGLDVADAAAQPGDVEGVEARR